MADQETHVLVYSSNRGRYCLDDSETGRDITSGEPISIEVLNGVWVDGRIEHAGRYAIDTPGLYSIADQGMPKDASVQSEPMTEEELKQSVAANMRKGMSLADALSATTNQIVGIFRGYYFISVDGQILGICTGMHVRFRVK